MPPPPPPPPAQQQQQLPLAPPSNLTNSMDQYLFSNFDRNTKIHVDNLISYCLDPSQMPPSSLMNDINSLSDEIDLLIDDNSSNNSGPPLAPSTSAFEDLSTWQNDYFQQNFYSDLFPNDSRLSMLSSTTNIDTDNSTNNFTSNALTFM